MPVTEPSDAVNAALVNRPMYVDLHFCTKLFPQLALWLVGWLVGFVFKGLTYTTHASPHEYLPITVMVEFWATVSKFGPSVDTSHL
jgi:hypothetical protein